MSDVSQHLSHIADVLKNGADGGVFTRPEFHAILDEIHLALDRQDSDGALVALIHGAIQMRTSDIHLEVYEKEASIRFRIDGDLSLLGTVSTKEHAMLVERMKYRANLKLNIHDVPQDGKFRFGKEGQEARIDVRVSAIPSRYGESLVCRILDSSSTVLTMEGLGIIGPQSEIIQSALSKKQGMVLVTGPTGSGKTTTLYTVIDALKKPEDKIITLEDPIEYQIPGVMQSEINERNGYTFAMGVRSVLRHDPDIIMIGEIRDFDTASTAVQASLTGHLVLSTLHTKSAFETLERLENMGLTAFDIAAALDIVISQRLVRKVCPHCAEKISENLTENDKNILEKYAISEPLSKKGKGCDKCGLTGYMGRVGIYEVLQVTDVIREAIRENKPHEQIQSLAQKSGFLTLADDARAKILLGITTREECERNGIL